MKTPKFINKQEITVRKELFQQNIINGFWECEQDVQQYVGYAGWTIIHQKTSKGTIRRSVVIKDYFKPY